MPLYQATDLFTLRKVRTVENKPGWMNLHAATRPEWKGEPAALAGPGLYGAFLRGKLFYIGLYAGKALNPFSGSVLDRWFKHATYHTLRSPKVEFRPVHLKGIVDLGGPVGQDIAACLPTDLSELSPEQYPLVARGSAGSTFRKAQFAAANWDIIGSQDDDALLAALSFVYCQVPRHWASQLLEVTDPKPSGWVKKNWLREAEAELIRRFKPICNSPIRPDEARTDVGPEEVERIMTELLDGLPIGAGSLPTPDAVPTGVSVTDPAILEAEEPEDGVEGTGVRQKLSSAGEALIDALETANVPGLAIDTTNIPDLRLYVVGVRRRVLMTIKAQADGHLRCDTLANPLACRAVGVEAEPLPQSGTMNSRFYIDPAVADASTLLMIAGAALATLQEYKPQFG